MAFWDDNFSQSGFANPLQDQFTEYTTKPLVASSPLGVYASNAPDVASGAIGSANGLGALGTAPQPQSQGGFTASQEQGIRDYWNQYRDDEKSIQNAMNTYGVSASDLSRIAGLNEQSLNDYLNNVGTYGGLGTDLPSWDVFNNQYMVRLNAQKPGGVQGAGQGSGPFSAGGGGGYGGGGGSSVGGGFSYSSTGQNPYLSQMGDVMTRQMTDNFNRKVMPQIGSQAMATGGYGGSRQGVIEANAMNDLNQQIGGALTNLYGQGYNTSLSHDLGLQNLGLGYANLDRSINNDNLNWQLQGANFGLGVYDRMQQGNQMGLNAATNIQNTPYNYWQNFSNQANSIGQGYGTQTSSTGGNPFIGALGGAQLGSQAANWWNSQNGSNNSQPYNPATADAMAASLNANGYWGGR